MLQGKKILLGVTGSIAAYKSILLVRQLVKAGAHVQVIMTPAARDFVTPLTLATLSKNPVLTELFEGDSWSNHVLLARSSDVLLIAPLSCHSLAKMAGGFCDNLLMAIYLSAKCPVLVAPAMDEDMWLHPSTSGNLQKIQSFGNVVIPVGEGELASGLHGEGRMAEPSIIQQYIEDLFSHQDLKGIKALVTAGPTQEAIDPVRFIGNRSTGKMGISIANELARRGASVDLIIGPSAPLPLTPGITAYPVESAGEMLDACLSKFPDSSIAVLAAAVADYRPLTFSSEKMKKKEDTMTLSLTKTKDILHTLGLQKTARQVLVGFALETSNEKEFALNKLKNKNADLIVLNSLRDQGAGFGYDTNKISIFEKDGNELSYERKSKQAVARDIVDRIVKMLHA